ncbi:MAG: hypothetical protein F4Z74_02735 [Acidobacteria bacterium]|nr:hypothetical protein [Acidobacteriota bacterium]MYE44470.1 hypothetical protein [Acidobacteriota bacterium]
MGYHVRGCCPWTKTEVIFETRWRQEGLRPDSEYVFQVASMDERGWTSLWEGIRNYGRTDAPDQGSCSGERQRAVRYGAVLPHEWTTTPFRFDVIESDEADATTYLRDSLKVVSVLADRIEDRLGYRIVEAGDIIAPSEHAPADWLSTWQDAIDHCGSEREPGQLLGLMIDTRPSSHRGGGSSSALVGCASVTYYRHRETETFLPEFREAVVHEIFHLFGFKHYDVPDSARSGVFMSPDLTGMIFAEGEDWRTTVSDLDALGCVFPHPDFPR